ncbi:MAG: thioredoxin domain-containing protein [Flavobacteriaceae bacterium]
MAKASTPKKNALAHAQSPYLLQHATNPVHWFPWEDFPLLKAKKEEKLLIISIGYAACHWCHVMEHESFEDEEVATVMNEHFISIKVDREERPDIDQVYMQALQILTGQGGWPLNIVALPDGRPIWGGTYFPKAQWLDYLQQIVKLQQEEPQRLTQYAQHLEDSMQQLELEKNKEEHLLEQSALDQACENLASKFDHKNGGLLGAPKFMMPTLINLFLSKNEFKEHAHFSLKKMALGGIFDVLGGGFSRYAVDDRWHVPHFEKMGYDNGQLLYCYSAAYRLKKDRLYKEIVDKTITFLTKELQASKGGFYAALDADSLDQNNNLEEGAFYVWTKEELTQLGLAQQKHFCSYFGIDQSGYWEKDQYVLFRKNSLDEYIAQHQLDFSFNYTVKKWEEQLLKSRSLRSSPRLDDKILCSWNALIGRGILKAAKSFENKTYAALVKRHLIWMERTFHYEQGGLFRLNKVNATPVVGFLEDYAHLIAYYLDAYEYFFEPHFLEKSGKLIAYCNDHFSVGDLFQFTEEDKLILQFKEVNDNVIPSSNAIMAENLLRASIHLGEPKWTTQANKMIALLGKELLDYPRAYSSWLRLALSLHKGSREIVIVGPKAKEWAQDLQNSPLEVNHWAASEKESNYPLFKGRYKANTTLIYYCENNQCQLPFNDLNKFKQAFKLTPS